MDRTSIAELTTLVTRFRDERNWSQFHTLRNLIVSLNLEAAELLELTQWKPDPEIESLSADESASIALRDECADVLAYLLLIAERAGIDLADALRVKMEKNALKYPVEASFGSNRKYTELDG